MLLALLARSLRYRGGPRPLDQVAQLDRLALVAGERLEIRGLPRQAVECLALCPVGLLEQLGEPRHRRGQAQRRRGVVGLLFDLATEQRPGDLAELLRAGRAIADAQRRQ